MFTQTFQIGAYIPALAAEQAGKVNDQLAVVDGENFIWNLRGVQSSFGVAETVESQVITGRHPGCFNIANERIFCMGDGLYKLVNGALVLQIGQAATQAHPTYDLAGYKWSYAYVGTRHWFCHPTFPQLFYYDEFDDVWGLFRDDCWDGPVYSITQADNSLIVLLEDVVVWSKFDEGNVFNCETYCESGAQSLARVRYGQPFAVMPYNGAWLTFTSMGIMLSRATGEQAQHPDMRSLIIGPARFNHSDVSHELMPYGPTAICHIDTRSVIWLAPQGFYSFSPAQGGGFGSIGPYAPEMSIFYKETLVPYAADASSLLDEFQLDYVDEVRWLAVSSRVGEQMHYGRAHIYQPEKDRWGSFNHGHLLILPRARDDEIAGQQRSRRHVATIGPLGALTTYDKQASAARSWIKFSPSRLQAPQELNHRAVHSVQGVRFGCAETPWFSLGPRGLQSDWRMDLATEVHPSVFKTALLAGDGPTQLIVDEAEYLTPFRRTTNTAHFTCHVTGGALSLYVLALEPDEHFDIRHVEMDFFFAGEL